MRTAIWLLLLAVLAGYPPSGAAEEQPLVVESLQCRGNATTSCGFILGQLYLSAGDPVNEEEIENAKLRLSFLRNFSSVSIFLERGSERGKAIVVVEVQEANPITWEAALGFAKVLDSRAQFASAGVTDYNLFGRGKILSFGVAETTPLDGPELRNLVARVQYVDTHLRDSKRNFFVVGGFYRKLHAENKTGALSDGEFAGVDAVFGRRLWDFSYITLGMQYRPLRELHTETPQFDGSTTIEDGKAKSGLGLLSYGWNSYDDPYFPTHGSALNLSFGIGESFDFGARKTWSTRNGTVWTFSYVDDDHFNLRRARPLPTTGLLSGARRARWYAGIGYLPIADKPVGGDIWTYRGELGLRFETQSLGIVELSVFGDVEKK
jgi:outer membrane protein assembly factor BamA